MSQVFLAAKALKHLKVAPGTPLHAIVGDLVKINDSAQLDSQLILED
jgi:hypothetical protein